MSNNFSWSKHEVKKSDKKSGFSMNGKTALGTYNKNCLSNAFPSLNWDRNFTISTWKELFKVADFTSTSKKQACGLEPSSSVSAVLRIWMAWIMLKTYLASNSSMFAVKYLIVNRFKSILSAKYWSAKLSRWVVSSWWSRDPSTFEEERMLTEDWSASTWSDDSSSSYE